MNELAGTTLLRKLGSGVLPTDRLPGSQQARVDDFAAMLERAKAGGVSSGLTVTVDPGLGLELASEKIDALSSLADQAQARGIQRLLVRDGAHQYILDVERRVVIQHLQQGQPGFVAGIDAVVDLPGNAGHAQEGQVAGNAPGTSASDLPGSLLLRGLGTVHRSGQ